MKSFFDRNIFVVFVAGLLLGIFVFILVPNRSQQKMLEVAPGFSNLKNLDDHSTPGNIDSVFSLLNPFRFTSREFNVLIEEGQTLGTALNKAGIGNTEIKEISAALQPVFDVGRIRPGTLIMVRPAGKVTVGEEEFVTVSALEIILSPLRSVMVQKKGSTFTAYEDSRSGVSELVRKDFTVPAGSSLFAEAEKVGVPESIISQIDYIYSFDVSFAHDIHPGDGLSLVYEKLYSKLGESVDGSEKLLMADLKSRGISRKIYRFERDDGKVEFYNEEGKSAQKTLKRAPIGGRISSGFGMRRHPVLGFSRQHKGTDFPAPQGTPIRAGGDGVVNFKGWRNGYGNYIKVRHNANYETAYAHCSAFASGVNVGTRVRQGQVIAYVGNTGISTGPHLHYEMIKNGAHVNALTAPLPAGRNLKGEELDKFISMRKKIDEKYVSLGRTTINYASEIFGN